MAVWALVVGERQQDATERGHELRLIAHECTERADQQITRVGLVVTPRRRSRQAVSPVTSVVEQDFEGSLFRFLDGGRQGESHELPQIQLNLHQFDEAARDRAVVVKRRGALASGFTHAVPKLWSVQQGAQVVRQIRHAGTVIEDARVRKLHAVPGLEARLWSDDRLTREILLRDT